MKKLVLLFGFLLSISASAHQDGENTAPLDVNPDSQTEAQKQVIRDAAKDFCSEKEDDDKEECTVDFFANHNLQEEPSCD